MQLKVWASFRYGCWATRSAHVPKAPSTAHTKPSISRVWTQTGISLLTSYRIERHERIGFLLHHGNELQNNELSSISNNPSRLPFIDLPTAISNLRAFDTKLCTVDAALNMAKRQSRGSVFPETPQAQFA